MKAYADRDYPRRDLAPLPPDCQPWLLVLPAVLVSPFPVRKGGPNQDEAKAIREMQRRLMEDPVAIWISPNGNVAAQTIKSSVLKAKTHGMISVRLPLPK